VRIMEQFFIRTRDENTKELLLKNNFTFLNKEGDFYIFINDGKAEFSDSVRDEIYYSNKLNV